MPSCVDGTVAGAPPRSLRGVHFSAAVHPSASSLGIRNGVPVAKRFRNGSEGSCELEWIRPEIRSEFPRAEERTPGRSPRSMSRGWQTRVPSRKSGRVLRAASYTEALHMLDVEFDYQAIGMCEQPMGIRLPDRSRHRPDAFVWMRHGPHEIREVKKEDEALKKEDRWEAIGRAVASFGFVYRVIMDTRLHYSARRENIDLFMAHRHAQLPDHRFLSALWDFVGDRSITIADLRIAFPTLRLPQIFALLRLGFVAVVDLDRPFDDLTRIVRLQRNVRTVAHDFRHDNGDCSDHYFPGETA